MPTRNKPITKEKWYESSVKKGFAILSGFVFVASIGYGLAIVQKNLEFRIEKYEMQQEFNEKLQTQIFDCQKEKQLIENKRVEAMESAIKEIQKKFNEK